MCVINLYIQIIFFTIFENSKVFSKQLSYNFSENCNFTCKGISKPVRGDDWKPIWTNVSCAMKHARKYKQSINFPMGNALIISLHRLRPGSLTLCGNCAFPRSFYTRKLGKITVFYVVEIETTTFLFWFL